MKSGEIFSHWFAGKWLPLHAGVSLSDHLRCRISDQPQFSAIEIDVTTLKVTLSPFTVLPSRINTPPAVQ